MHKKPWFYASAYFLIFSTILWAGLGIVYIFGISQKRATFIAAEMAELEMIASSLLEEQSSVLEDLYLLASLKETEKLLLRQPDPNNTVEYASLMLMKTRQKYDQMRILDSNGMERLRANYYDGNPAIVPIGELQDKSKRAYYLDAKNLSPGEVYLSPLDLNVENEMIEIPYKPMLRYVMPVTDQNRSTIGYVVINYLADRLRVRAEQMILHEKQAHWLLNAEGYYLFGPDPDRLWGFQIPEHAEHTLENNDPELWKLLQSQDSGYLGRKNDFRFFKTIDITDFSSGFLDSLYGSAMRMPSGEKAPGRKWYFVMDSGRELWLEETAVLREPILLIGLFGMVMILVISVIVARITQVNREMKEQLVKDATFDELTGAYNRKAGFLLVKTCVENARRTNETSILCFIDANNLKLINDTFGHELGDQFLIGVVESLKEAIRRTDRIIRYGGDEFIALLQKCDEAKATELLEKANASLREKGESQGSKVPWSFSYGCVVFDGNQPDEVDALISRADALMYKHKQDYKSLHKEALMLSPRKEV